MDRDGAGKSFIYTLQGKYKRREGYKNNGARVYPPLCDKCSRVVFDAAFPQENYLDSNAGPRLVRQSERRLKNSWFWRN